MQHFVVYFIIITLLIGIRLLGVCLNMFDFTPVRTLCFIHVDFTALAWLAVYINEVVLDLIFLCSYLIVQTVVAFFINLYIFFSCAIFALP